MVVNVVLGMVLSVMRGAGWIIGWTPMLEVRDVPRTGREECMMRDYEKGRVGLR